eukprot:6183222-Pleurochrysis_carterae.AAC.1
MRISSSRPSLAPPSVFSASSICSFEIPRTCRHRTNGCAWCLWWGDGVGQGVVVHIFVDMGSEGSGGDGGGVCGGLRDGSAAVAFWSSNLLFVPMKGIALIRYALCRGKSA